MSVAFIFLSAPGCGARTGLFVDGGIESRRARDASTDTDGSAPDGGIAEHDGGLGPPLGCVVDEPGCSWRAGPSVALGGPGELGATLIPDGIASCDLGRILVYRGSSGRLAIDVIELRDVPVVAATIELDEFPGIVIPLDDGWLAISSGAAGVGCRLEWRTPDYAMVRARTLDEYDTCDGFRGPAGDAILALSRSGRDGPFELAEIHAPDDPIVVRATLPEGVGLLQFDIVNARSDAWLVGVWSSEFVTVQDLRFLASLPDGSMRVGPTIHGDLLYVTENPETQGVVVLVNDGSGPELRHVDFDGSEFSATTSIRPPGDDIDRGSGLSSSRRHTLIHLVHGGALAVPLDGGDAMRMGPAPGTENGDLVFSPGAAFGGEVYLAWVRDHEQVMFRQMSCE